MADIRINALATTAASTASDDFIAVDGSANGTRKLNAYSPTFGGNLTVSGGTITGGASGLSLASGGTNQSITLTPSGTGKVTLSNGTSAQPMLDITNTNTVPTKNGLRILGPNATSSSARQFALMANSTAYGDLELRRSTTNTGDPTSGDYIFGVSANGNLLLGTTTDDVGKLQVNGSVTAYTGAKAVSGSSSLVLKSTDASALSGALTLYTNATGSSRYLKLEAFEQGFGGRSLVLQENGGSVLVATNVDSGNGKLQLATHTTSAGGIGFGTETQIYRRAAGNLAIDSNQGSTILTLSYLGNVEGSLSGSSSGGLTLAANGATSLLLATNGTTALTLAADQSATFAGRAILDGANSVLVVKGANPTGVASSTIVDYAGGSRIISYGSTTGTASGFSFIGLSSNGSVGGTRFSIDSAGDATFAGNVTASKAGTAFYSIESTVNGAISEVIVKGKNSTGTAREARLGLNKYADDVFSIYDGTTERFRLGLTNGNATITGALAINNTVQTAVAVASTHKVTISIGGSTYYLLATNV